jgi:hypothetical protein
VYPNAPGSGELHAASGTTNCADAFTHHATQAPEPSPATVRTPFEGLPDLWKAVYLAEEMGAGLGAGQVLLGAVPAGGFLTGGVIDVRRLLNCFNTKGQRREGAKNCGGWRDVFARGSAFRCERDDGMLLELPQQGQGAHTARTQQGISTAKASRLHPGFEKQCRPAQPRPIRQRRRVTKLFAPLRLCPFALTLLTLLTLFSEHHRPQISIP